MRWANKIGADVMDGLPLTVRKAEGRGGFHRGRKLAGEAANARPPVVVARTIISASCPARYSS